LAAQTLNVGGSMTRTFAILSRCAFAILIGFDLPACMQHQARSQEQIHQGALVKDLSLSPEQRKTYVGTYATQLPGGENVTLRILEGNGALRLWASNPDESRRLFYQGENIFLVENAPGFVLTFVVVRNTAMTIKVHKPEGDLVAMRVD
jgi:hypothetical protein